MADRLPPLNAVRYFEAAARHLSFTKAAQELFVTHSAISHQIKALEDWLGVALFRRMNRSLVLTEAGQIYLKPVREAFDRLKDGTRQIRVRETGGPLTVSTVPSFAAKWLVPKLRRFRDAHPEIDVRISATGNLVDFAREDVDVAIRHGRGNWGPGLRVDAMLPERLYAVCSPKLLDGKKPLRVPADLAFHTLLYDYDWIEDLWAKWLRAAGLEDVNPRRGIGFNYSNLMIQAAIDGLGVALTHDALAGDDIAAGLLVRPFDLTLPSDTCYYVVSPEATADRPKIKAFREWVLAEAEESKSLALQGLEEGPAISMGSRSFPRTHPPAMPGRAPARQSSSGSKRSIAAERRSAPLAKQSRR